MWLCDGQLYGYEYSTALIVRMLQLSLPDENTAMLIGLAGAVVEVGTRIFFYMLFLKKGLANPRMTDEEKKKYAMRGKLRIQDASNDMVVEYVGASGAWARAKRAQATCAQAQRSQERAAAPPLPPSSVPSLSPPDPSFVCARFARAGT
jgi:hypothetical protein